MIEYIKTHICEHIDKSIQSNDLSFIQLSNSKLQDGKIIFLIFKKNENRPWLVAKIMRTPLYSAIMEERFRHLLYISSQLPAKVKLHVSIPITLFHIGSDSILIEKFLPGNPLWTIIGAPNYLNSKGNLMESIKPVLDWLFNFNVATCSATTTNRRVFYELVNRFLKLAQVNNDVVTTVRAVVEKYDLCVDFPLVGVHGDFSPQNILLDNKKNVNIIDWELFLPRGIPLYDFFMLSITCGAARYTHNYTEWHLRYINGMQDTFLKDNSLSEMLREFLREYCKEFNIDRNICVVFLLLLLLDLSVREKYILGSAISKDMIWEKVLIYFVRNIGIYKKAFTL